MAGISGRSTAWLVRSVWDREVVGSNPIAPIFSFNSLPLAAEAEIDQVPRIVPLQLSYWVPEAARREPLPSSAGPAIGRESPFSLPLSDAGIYQAR